MGPVFQYQEVIAIYSLVNSELISNMAISILNMMNTKIYTHPSESALDYLRACALSPLFPTH